MGRHGAVFAALLRAGLINDLGRDARSKRNMSQIVLWISDRGPMSEEDVSSVYGQVRDQQLSTLRAGRRRSVPVTESRKAVTKPLYDRRGPGG